LTDNLTTCVPVIFVLFTKKGGAYYTVLLSSQYCLCSKSSTQYLNKGAGEPCAGQARLKDDPRRARNDPRIWELDANFGAEDPTGSRKIKMENYLKLSLDMRLNDGGNP
jgi:hypothetical protein